MTILVKYLLTNAAKIADEILAGFAENLTPEALGKRTLNRVFDVIGFSKETKKKATAEIATIDTESKVAPEDARARIDDLESEKLDEVSKNFEVEKEKREIAETERSMFANIGAFSNNENFVCGDAEGDIKWTEGEIEAFDEVVIQPDF
ncbi:hypothetical protein ACJX0J_040290, partial [Zea mays]